MCCIATLSSYFCTFLFYWLFFLELGLSLKEFYRKFAILTTFTDASTQKRVNSTNNEEEEFREILESSFDADEDEREKITNSNSKKKPQVQDINDLPVLKLNNPQNIIVWANIRTYLQVLSERNFPLRNPEIQPSKTS